MGKRDEIKDRREMLRAGYEFKSKSTCRVCGLGIEWWKTTRGKMIPFDPIANDYVDTVPHWQTCPKADLPAPAASTAVAARTANPIDREVEALRSRSNARAIIVLFDDGGEVAAWRNGIPAEDLRNEIITAANNVRNAISRGDQ